MAVAHIELVRKFKGEPVVLLAMDAEGLHVIRMAFASARQGRVCSAVTGLAALEIRPESDQAAIHLESVPTVWRLSPKKIGEIVEKLASMQEVSRPGHRYVDIVFPTRTLVLAKDEYLLY